MCKKVIVLSMLLVSMGWLSSAAMAQPPVKTNLVFWLDASNGGSLTLSGDKVTRWNDLSGAGNYTDQTTASLQPTYVKGKLAGKGIVDFGDSVYGNPLATYQPWMQMRNASGAVLHISTIRTVFWVLGMDSGTNGFLLGDDTNYDFHRGTTNQIWEAPNGWASVNIRNGSTYLNGVKVDGTTTVLPTAFSMVSLVTTANVQTSRIACDRTYRSGGIKLGELLIYDRALTDAERVSVEAYLHAKWFVPGSASGPQPEDGATDVIRDVILSWTAGNFAKTHDVYLGTVFADVNDASRANPKNTLVSQAQPDATYDAGRLALGQTYYWRADEVNAPPDSTIFKGAVWKFTVEPYSYPIAGTAITATASSSSGVEMGPQKTIDGSGMSGDQHGTTPTDMWLSGTGVTGATWIQYAFDKSYKLDQMWVWNSNQLLESFIGFGAKSVTVESSADGANWTKLGDFEFARAPGAAGYSPNTKVTFAGVMAKYVKLTMQSNWGGMVKQYGLSEVRFLYVPVAARQPSPASGATGIAPQVTLSWRVGREAASHQVLLGTDANNLTQAATVSAPSYNANVNLNQTYYWKVVEVNQANNPTAWPGDVWSFTTAAYSVVDGFESYTDKVGEEVFSTWVDGLTNSLSGSTVGYLTAANGTFDETAIVHGGRQSMPLQYDNTAKSFSEAVRTFDPAQNWTASGIKSLSLYFQGAAANTGGQLYVKINNTKVSYNGSSGDLAKPAWTPWNIDLSTVGGLSKVTSLTIGIEGAGSKGIVYVDDIRLYPKTPEYLLPVDPGKTNLVALYALDGNANDASGKGNNGIVNGTGTWVPGKINQALQFDGTSTYVDCGKGASLNLTDEVTITAWIKMDFTAGDRKIAGNQDGTTGGYKFGIYTNNMIEFEIRTSANAGTLSRNAAGGTALQQGVWYHVAGVYSSKGQYIRTYVYGNLDRELLTTALLGSSTGTFKLGREPFSASYYWLGAMDDVAVYNRALSPEEILWLAGQKTPVAKPF
jgi:hypothetical protein